MDTLLQPPSIHNKVMVCWAWHAYTSMHSTPQSRRLKQIAAERSGQVTEQAQVANLVDMIEKRLTQIMTEQSSDKTPPDVYANDVLRVLRDEFSQAPQAPTILSKFHEYLSRLARPDSDPLRDLCEAVILSSIHGYFHHGVKVPKDAQSLKLGINAGWIRVPPKPTFQSPFLGMALVENRCREACCAGVSQERRTHFQTLRITLSPARFDADTLAALPFVLFHECVSHVLQGPWTPTRKSPGPDSMFAEGWMDRAALAVFEGALTNRPPWGQISLIHYPHKPNFFKGVAQQLYNARQSGKAMDFAYDLEAASRKEGVEVAEDVIHMYHRLSFQDPLKEFLHLSFALNASDFPPAQRDTFIQCLKSRMEPEAPASVEADLAAALRRFARDGDIHTLFKIAYCA